MKLWVFAADNLKNIRIGYDHRMWAVSVLEEKDMKSRRTKGSKMAPFSRGIIYSSADKTFTMPFRTLSYPAEGIIEEIWPEAWAMPFQIHPLGSPRKKVLGLQTAKKAWPILGTRRNAGHALNGITGRTIFVPNEIEVSDWTRILSDLADEPDTNFPEPHDPSS